MSKLGNLLKNIEEFIAFQQDEDFDAVQVNPATLKELLSYFDNPERAPQPASRPAAVKPVARQAQPKPAPKPIEKPKPTIQLPDFQSMEEIAEHISQCKRCPLCKTRSLTVPGEGNVNRPEIMFIGEGPRFEEDKQGRPLVGPAGQLFAKMVAAMGYTREEVFIGTVIKCRAFHTETNKDRRPTADETFNCLPYLKAQIKLIKPKVIVALGQTASRILLNEKAAITQLHGKWRKFEGIDLMPTYQPDLLLRHPEYKGDTWSDLKAVLAHLGKPVPQPKKKQAP
ncbi:uracil-DNA glycosylase family protein [Verrucomicrobiota bacterium]